MERIKKTKTIFKTVPDKEEKYYVYIAEDGKEFDDFQKCLDYEKILKIKKSIKTVEIKNDEFEGFPRKYLSCSTKEAIELVIDGYIHGYFYFNEQDVTRTELSNLVTLDTWFGIIVEYGGDYADNIKFYTLDYVKKTLSDCLKELENLEIKG